MNTYFVVIFLVLSSICQGRAEAIPEEFRTRPGKVVAETNWPGDFKRIVAVTYDFEQDKGDDVVLDGHLHKGIFLTSKDLTPEQIKKLYAAITGVHTHQKAAMCFEPHHGVIFYDSENKIIGSLTICFGCKFYKHSPAGEVSKVFDLEGLENLMIDLKMPVLHSKPNGYRALYEKYKKDKETR